MTKADFCHRKCNRLQLSVSIHWVFLQWVQLLVRFSVTKISYWSTRVFVCFLLSTRQAISKHVNKWLKMNRVCLKNGVKIIQISIKRWRSSGIGTTVKVFQHFILQNVYPSWRKIHLIHCQHRIYLHFIKVCDLYQYLYYYYVWQTTICKYTDYKIDISGKQ